MATVEVNGQIQELAPAEHWRFHELALETSDTVQVEFALTSDPFVERGGWSLDKVCVVAKPLPDQPRAEDDDRPGLGRGEGAVIRACGCGVGGPVSALPPLGIMALLVLRRRIHG